MKRHGGRLMTIQGAQMVRRALAPRHTLETHPSLLAPEGHQIYIPGRPETF